MLSPLAQARALCQRGDLQSAEVILLDFCREKLGLDCRSAKLNPDGYSLNSLNGILRLGTPYLGQERLFFKYHQEEDESKGVAEYYNSKLLEEAGLPVDVPLAARHEPGEQILLYRERTDARLADVCRHLEHGRETGFTAEEVANLQEQLDLEVGQKYLETLHLAPREKVAHESLHQLFYYRLIDGPSVRPQPGGRWKSYYIDQEFAFPGLPAPLAWKELAALKWRVNGRLYRRTLGELFEEALTVLDPANLSEPCPAVLGHGDAHNANLWIERGGERSRLVFFDPAFAGAHLPALLAEIKPTFHNIFAHPDWLYHPDDAAMQLKGNAVVRGDALEVEHDWEPTPLRQAFLDSKQRHVWKPLLASPLLAGQAWERYVRLALFCCPTLVMNLRAGAARHNAITSLVGLSIAMMCGSECDRGDDLVSRFIAEIAS